jgi:FlaA1/EpsC-like NDP-sugar epimerase
VRRRIAVTDLLSLATALLVGHQLRFGYLTSQPLVTVMLIVVPAMLAIFAALGLYRDHPAPTPVAELGRSVLAVTVVMLGFLMAASWAEQFVSRSWLALTWMITLALVVASRIGWRFAADRRSAAGT